MLLRTCLRFHNLALAAAILLAIPLFLNSAVIAKTRSVKVYLVAVDDGGKAGKKIGCGDSLVAVSRKIKPTVATLAAAMRELLATPSQDDATPKLENFWRGNNLALKSVSLRRRIATIHFTGELTVAGVCDEPRITEQVEATARQFPTVRRVRVFINNVALAEAIH